MSAVEPDGSGQSGRYQQTLEAQLNPEQELNASLRRRAHMVPAETLYTSRWSEPRHRVYQHYSEERIHVINSQSDMRFIQESSYNRLRREGMQHIHLGMMMVRLAVTHRRNARVMATVVFRDTRWSGDTSIIGTIEADLSDGTQMVYIAPDMLLSIHDFYHHIQVAVITRGYDDWQGGESNLLITRSLIGRLTNTSVSGFRY